MSLNYGVLDSFRMLLSCLKYNIMISIVISSIIILFLLFINRKNCISKYIPIILNLFLIIIILIYYTKGILSLKFSNPINNIYFYFLNSIIYLIIVSILNIKKDNKLILYIVYGISLINIMFSLFMTYYLSNSTVIVIGNIFPMIKFGNIIYILYYAYEIASLLFLTKKR